ncbi:hypothetical protein FJZ40_02905 [Candidatus Shapirobacteria bacterium]|nr:hypothetical protein [Candidatus Shapirobacteria bacterium]
MRKGLVRIIKIITIIILILGSLYLILPSPPELPPLPESLRSVEPGDTVQIPGVSAYYTDLPRKEIVDFYTKPFSRSSFLGIPLITYRLNHPPERIREVLRETQQSTYVEEVTHPLRESLFISGFEWENDPFTKPSRRIKNASVVNGRTYKCKVTLFYQGAKPWQRLLVFGGIYLCGFLIYRGFKAVYETFRNHS